MEKRVNLRVEHVRHSKCRQEFLDRVKANAAAKKEAKEKGIHIDTRRQPAKPREAHTLSVKADNAVETVTAIPYDTYIVRVILPSSADPVLSKGLVLSHGPDTCTILSLSSCNQCSTVIAWTENSSRRMCTDKLILRGSARFEARHALILFSRALWSEAWMRLT